MSRDLSTAEAVALSSLRSPAMSQKQLVQTLKLAYPAPQNPLNPLEILVTGETASSERIHSTVERFKHTNELGHTQNNNNNKGSNRAHFQY